MSEFSGDWNLYYMVRKGDLICDAIFLLTECKKVKREDWLGTRGEDPQKQNACTPYSRNG